MRSLESGRNKIAGRLACARWEREVSTTWLMLNSPISTCRVPAVTLVAYTRSLTSSTLDPNAEAYQQQQPQRWKWSALRP